MFLRNFIFSNNYMSKNSLFIIVFFTLLFSSCKNEQIVPTANFSLVSKNSVPPCEVTFTNTSINATSYLWEFGDGLQSTSKNPIHTYTKGGEYKVILNATNSVGSNSIYRYARVALAP